MCTIYIRCRWVFNLIFSLEFMKMTRQLRHRKFPADIVEIKIEHMKSQQQLNLSTEQFTRLKRTLSEMEAFINQKSKSINQNLNSNFIGIMIHEKMHLYRS